MRRPRRARRIPPLPPRNVGRDYVAQFSLLDPRLAREVALEVHRRTREAPTRSREIVELVLLGIGQEHGFGRTRGFQLLRAGRYLIYKDKRKKTWTRK